MRKSFFDEDQKTLWKAFKGECGEEFKGNPFIMENFMKTERYRESKDKDEGRDL